MTERTYTRAEVDAEVASAKQLQHEVTLEAAAKKGHMAAFNFLGMDKTQRAYSWHDVEDALTEGSAAIRALSTRPDLLARHDAEVRLEEAEWWEHLAPDCGMPPSGNTECLYCQRLAVLRAEKDKEPSHE